ncbi:hypothetical protein [Treponema pedis]|uniref:hypothetical protein n=1 Tax=Treponema pedis TaxID=409322 RepID=UPI001980E4CA|nr:hypothetical protein [Treponema pedis]QSI03457.1 hypothetical protein DYQ05_00245 [Treponema pedis]
MKKTKLFNRTAVLAFMGTLFLFSACKQYKASLEEYLSYWSSQAYISSMHIDSSVLIDEQGFTQHKLRSGLKYYPYSSKSEKIRIYNAFCG